ncbi:MAG: phosphoglycerate dehydrogenase [Clostridia bacterium]|nr:phosphoglycerate dehydrogenase [Clostridia bacterium]
MFSIKTMNKIAAVGTKRFGDNYTVSDTEQNPDGILVRSASLLDGNFNDGLLAIARAGAGVNNIPIDLCTSKGIAVFNTPGANANAVKELTIAGMLLASRRIVESINWAQTLKGKGDEIPKLVEKGKSDFAGPELEGKKLGVIGLGAIGSLIVNAAHGLNMEVYGYDNYLSVESALRMTRNVKRVENVKTIYEECDYITYHVPLNDSTRRYINKEVFAQMKDGVRLFNFSRGEIVNEDDLEEALNSGKVAKYVTDFPNERILSMKNVIAIPHLAASTMESEDNCAVMAVDELKDYLENGNVKNSVNFPNVASERATGDRICVLHKNIPNMLSRISSVLGDMSINIEFMHSKSRGEIGYALLDLAGSVPDSVAENLKNIDGVLLVRIIK